MNGNYSRISYECYCIKHSSISHQSRIFTIDYSYTVNCKSTTKVGELRHPGHKRACVSLEMNVLKG